LNKDAEEQLIADLKSDPEKFSLVFDHYYAPIFGYIFRRVTDYDVACDIVSETFLKAFLNIGSFEWKGISLSYWLYRIATNEMQQFFRKNKYTPESLSLLIDKGNWDMIDPKTSQEEKNQMERELNAHQDFLMIQERIKTLPVKYQEVLALRYFEQKAIREIALILQKNENTVKSLILRGLERLKRLL
jgi:RNA polymerase sigma-70 factor (ECF subfamily)